MRDGDDAFGCFVMLSIIAGFMFVIFMVGFFTGQRYENGEISFPAIRFVTKDTDGREAGE